MKRVLSSVLVAIGAAAIAVAPAHADEIPKPGVTASQEAAILGSDIEFTFTPNRTGVVRYTYTYLSDTNGEVWAQPDGTAKVKFRVDTSTGVSIEVGSYTAEGSFSGTTRLQVDPADSSPIVTRDGDTFTFAPRNTERVSGYDFWFDGRKSFVQARADGTAEIELPHGPGSHDLSVSTLTTSFAASWVTYLYWER